MPRSTEVSISASEGVGEERGLVEEGSPSSLSNPELRDVGAGYPESSRLEERGDQNPVEADGTRSTPMEPRTEQSKGKLRTTTRNDARMKWVH